MIADLAVVAKSAIKKAGGNAEALEFDGGATADVAGEESGAESGVVLDDVEQFRDADMESTMRIALQAEFQGLEIDLPERGDLRKREFAPGVAEQLSDHGSVGGTRKVEWGKIFAGDLKNLFGGVEKGTSSGTSAVEQGAVDVEQQKSLLHGSSTGLARVLFEPHLRRRFHLQRPLKEPQLPGGELRGLRRDARVRCLLPRG